jgi:hypothetical protein
VIAATGESAAAAMTLRAASADVPGRARIATRTARLRSDAAAAGVKRKSLLRRVPRRASVAASLGSETAGVKAPTGRAFIEAAGRAALSRWVEAAMAGASNSAIATSDALPTPVMAPILLKTYDSKPNGFSTSRPPFP